MMFELYYKYFNNIITYIFIQPSPIYKNFKNVEMENMNSQWGKIFEMKDGEDDVLG